MNAVWARGVVGTLITLLIGCSTPEKQESTKAALSSDSVKIVSFSPSGKQSLVAGEKVVFRFEVEYTLSTAESGTLGMVVQRKEGERRVLASETRTVRKGSGREVLTAKIEVPDTSGVTVFTPLIPEGASGTKVVALRAFRVSKE